MCCHALRQAHNQTGYYFLKLSFFVSRNTPAMSYFSFFSASWHTHQSMHVKDEGGDICHVEK
jgi:hypothetical protein